MFVRRQARTHGRLMREELGESVGHFRMAAAHAAGGAAGLIAPRLDAAREKVEPKVSRSVDWIAVTAGDAARQGKKTARKATTKGKKGDSMARKRVPMMIGGFLAAGAVIGIAGALMSRRRQQKWQEYGSSQPVGSMKQGVRSMADSATKTGAETAVKAADAVKEKASDIARGSTPSTATSSTERASSMSESARTGEFGQSSADPFSRASATGAAASRNSRP